VSDFPYPIVENDIDNDPTPKDQAIYVPSVSLNYAIDAVAPSGLRAIPSHLPANVLNFLDPDNKLFRISHAMASAGQFLNSSRSNMFTQRDRTKTRIIGDSGGYQVAQGRLQLNNDGDRIRILHWLEQNADIAMTLDVPPGGIGKPGFKYHSVDECLEATLVNLAFFHQHRKKDGPLFLNVIQGNTVQESIDWYDAVKCYDFEGFAIAGALRNDIYHLCRLILLMHHDGQLGRKKWIHVLGTNDLGTAVMLTALQRAVKQHLGHNIRFSFDTATPFRMLAGNQVFGFPRFREEEMKIEQVRAPTGAKFHGKKLLWPWPSKLGDLMRMDDVIVPCGPTNTTQRDALGNHLLALHNLQALCFAIFNANRLFDVELITGQHSVGLKEGRAASAIDRVMRQPSLTRLQDYASWFDGLRKSYDRCTADEDRDLD
jgi:hypothetical protein